MQKLLTTLSILLIATASYAQTHTPKNDKSSTGYAVERVIDGDTLKLTNGEEVQLIGVQVPEDEKMGREATEFVKGLLPEGTKVRLEFDVQRRDKYGRLLAYLYIPITQDFTTRIMAPLWQNIYIPLDDKGKYEQFVNAHILAMGYATPMTIPPNVKYADLFKKLYEEAREQKRGLWAESTFSKDDAIKIAKEKLQKESFVNDVDINRVTVRFREELNDYWIDFAWNNASEITPGLWSEGYYVVIDKKNGRIKEFTAYER